MAIVFASENLATCEKNGMLHKTCNLKWYGDKELFKFDLALKSLRQENRILNVLDPILILGEVQRAVSHSRLLETNVKLFKNTEHRYSVSMNN